MTVLLRQAKLNEVMAKLIFVFLEQGFFSHVAREHKVDLIGSNKKSFPPN